MEIIILRAVLWFAIDGFAPMLPDLVQYLKIRAR
jgi:hypothetical protein